MVVKNQGFTVLVEDGFHILNNMSSVLQGSMLIEVVCLAYFSFRFGHSMHFTKRGIFWRDTKNILILVIIIVSIKTYRVHNFNFN